MASRRVLSHPLRSTSLRLLKTPAAFSSPRSSSPAGFPISRPPNPAGGFLFSRAVQYATSADDAASPSAVPSGKITDEFTGAGAVGQNHRYDYNHWLILMDFSEDPEQEPSPVLMIKTYFQTAAEVFGSMEEAKKRIYALSTTTYHGFQCLMDKATSEKFRGLPGVVFIMPDSYIDPVIKEYGGDKCENGRIIPRPPPMQYGDDRGTWSGCYSREFYDERR